MFKLKETKLSDGSTVYSIQVSDGEESFYIPAVDEAGALYLYNALVHFSMLNPIG
jgi:hypothetical protein